MEHTIPATIDAYIGGCLPQVRPQLHQLRRTIAEAAPQAGEKISWGMASFVLHGNLVHFPAEKKHIGFHPAPSAIDAFAGELVNYVCSKGTVRFPYDRPLPLELVGRMVAFREQEQLAHAKQSGKKATPRPQRSRYPMPQHVEQAIQREGLLKYSKRILLKMRHTGRCGTPHPSDTLEESQQAIDEYMDFYNTRRLQSKLKGLAPLDFRNQTLVT